MIDLPTLEQAKRLKELGIKHEWELGDRYWDSKRIGTLAGYEDIVWATKRGRPAWLPRLDQIMAEIERLVQEMAIIFAPALKDRRFCAVAPLDDEDNLGDALANGIGPNDTQAAADALIKVMEEQQASCSERSPVVPIEELVPIKELTQGRCDYCDVIVLNYELLEAPYRMIFCSEKCVYDWAVKYPREED